MTESTGRRRLARAVTLDDSPGAASRRPRNVRRFLLAGVTAVVLTACSSAVDGVATPTTTSSRSTTAPATSTSASSSSATRSSTVTSSTTSSSSAASSSTQPQTAPPGDTPETSQYAGNPDNIPWTPPGTQLTNGATATVGLTSVNADGVFDVTVTANVGTAADWATVGFDAAPVEGSIPWFVHATVTQRAGGAFAGLRPQEALTAWTTAGAPAERREIPVAATDNPLCRTGTAPPDFTIGSTVQGCTLFLLSPSDSADSVQYIGPIAGVTSDYLVNPVTWR